MPYAIELSQRQSARTIEQAIRHRAPIIIEPRIWPAEHRLTAQLEPPAEPGEAQNRELILSFERPEPPANLGEPAEGPAIEAAAPTTTLADLAPLIGSYCDAALHLGEQLYLFSTDVVAAEADESGRLRMRITRPEVLQVAQRRRFRRIELAHSAQVDLAWAHEDNPRMGGVAWLCNVSGEGMACRTEERVADTLWIGEQVLAEFSLVPGSHERFKLEGLLVSKSPNRDTGKVVLGIQFTTEGLQQGTAESLRLLRQRLVPRYAQPAGSRRGGSL